MSVLKNESTGKIRNSAIITIITAITFLLSILQALPENLKTKWVLLAITVLAALLNVLHPTKPA